MAGTNGAASTAPDLAKQRIADGCDGCDARQRAALAQALAEAALERAPAARGSWLDGMCAGDPALRRAVDAALDDQRDASAPGDLASRTRDSDDAPERLGHWRLLEEIGRGGMGTVYRAERADEFRQIAAVKVLHRGQDRGLWRRFVAERQILATLQHRHVAQLLDGGMTADGRPYLVLEYVDGSPIVQWCDERQLGLEARLQLFLDVCRAVAYAHRNLVVHRDLKPSNVLVTRSGEVKLVDFGIAKLLQVELSADSVLVTGTGHQLMTPAYASPEQVSGDAITTATDVHGLGLILFELLTGEQAQRVGVGSPREVVHAVLHEEPRRPSDVYRIPRDADRTERAAVELRARLRGSTPSRLRRRLNGDLDRIVRGALQKRPERRYATAEQLARDIERWFAGEPLRVRGPSLSYRATKFVRRHRWPLASVAAMVIALATYATSVTIQAERVRSALAQAHDAAQRADQVTTFMMELFEAGAPKESRSDTLTARELLRRGAERAEQLSAQPLVKAQMLEVVGRVYESLGEYGSAQPLLERALATRSVQLGALHQDVARTHRQLGGVLRARGEFGAAELHLRQALAADSASRRGRERELALAADLTGLAAVLAQRGDVRQAEPIYTEALALARRAGAAGDTIAANSLEGLGYVLSDRSASFEAEQRHREALAVRRRLFGDRHPDVARSLGNLASVLEDRGDYAGAERLHREVLALRRELLGPEHPSVATSMNNLAVSLARQGDTETAEELWRDVLAMRRRLLGEHHPSVFTARNNVAFALLQREQLAQAESSFRALVTDARSLPGLGPQPLLSAMNNLGAVLRRRGSLAESERVHAEAVALVRAHRGERHPDMAYAIRLWALTLAARQDYQRADSLLSLALAIDRETLPPDHPEIARVLQAQGELRRRQERWAEARELLNAALSLRRAKLGRSHPEVRESLAALADVADATGAAAEAAQFRRELATLSTSAR